MKTTDFAVNLGRYLTHYLPDDQGCSPNTIDSYRYAFIQYLEFMEEEKGIRPEKIQIRNLTRESVILFLTWLEKTRGLQVSSRNYRLAAIKGFIHYLKYELPEYMEEYQKILAIPLKKISQKEISYLKTDGVELLIKQIDTSTKNGMRDLVIIMILYTTGIRVSELINIRVKDVSLHDPCTILVHGKGNKGRYVPLLKTAVPHMRRYIDMMNYDKEEKLNDFLFINHMNKQFTRQGISYLLKKYSIKAREIDPSLIPEDLSPHKMRHTTAMELVDAGVDIMYIRDLLGHASVTTTEIYARNGARIKREKIEEASKGIVPPEEAVWENDTDLKSWLKSFNRK